VMERYAGPGHPPVAGGATEPATVIPSFSDPPKEECSVTELRARSTHDFFGGTGISLVSQIPGAAVQTVDNYTFAVFEYFGRY